MRGRPQLLCASCFRSAPEREEREARQRHPVYRRLDALREHRASAIAGGVIAIVLLLLGISSGAQLLSPAYRAQVGGAVAAVQRAAPPAAQSGQSGGAAAQGRVPTLIDRPCCGQGALAEAIPGSDGAALIDGVVGPTAPVWRSPPGFATADIRLRVRDATTAGRVLLALSTTAPRETWAKDVEVWISLSPDGAQAVLVGRWTLAATTEPQEFGFASTPVAHVRLRILSNYGSAEYTSLSEFALLAPNR